MLSTTRSFRKHDLCQYSTFYYPVLTSCSFFFSLAPFTISYFRVFQPAMQVCSDVFSRWSKKKNVSRYFCQPSRVTSVQQALNTSILGHFTLKTSHHLTREATTFQYMMGNLCRSYPSLSRSFGIGWTESRSHAWGSQRFHQLHFTISTDAANGNLALKHGTPNSPNWRENHLPYTSIVRFHVNFPGCMKSCHTCHFFHHNCPLLQSRYLKLSEILRDWKNRSICNVQMLPYIHRGESRWRNSQKVALYGAMISGYLILKIIRLAPQKKMWGTLKTQHTILPVP